VRGSSSGDMGQWPRVARFWRQIGTPLRPSEEDVGLYTGVLTSWCDASGRAPNGLILGVTPELYQLPWPDSTCLKAADRTPEMIQNVWPGDPAAVLLEDWRALSLKPASIDLVFCDGGLQLLDYPDGQRGLRDCLSRVVARGGLVTFRLFLPPLIHETPEQVIEALLDGRISDLNQLKLRLGMAMQADAKSGVELHAVWTRVSALGDWETLAAKLGWPVTHLAALDSYRDSTARYHFVTLAQAESTFCAGRDAPFSVAAVHTPGYSMGEQCPLLVLRRK